MNDQIEIIEIIMKIHLVCNLKTKFLINVDILDLKKINISFSQ